MTLEKIELGRFKYAAARNYFEVEEKFDKKMESILEGYDNAARMASVAAKNAARTGKRKTILESQWWEAAARMIELCLAYEIDYEFELPEPPNFDIFK